MGPRGVWEGMKISYHQFVSWLQGNLKSLLIIELLCLLVAGTYFWIAPRIFEASFSISLPKVPALESSNPQAKKLKLLISPQEFIRPTQNPMAYTPDFISQCMGEDTNANRKKLINALQLGVKQQGDVITFTLRLEGKEQLFKCANAMMWNALNNLQRMQEAYLSSQTLSSEQKLSIVPAEMTANVRMSDSYIKPDLSKILFSAITAGIFLTVFLSALRKKYRA